MKLCKRATMSSVMPKARSGRLRLHKVMRLIVTTALRFLSIVTWLRNLAQRVVEGVVSVS